jgi:NitT/TauT family transport system substrate-binding protein
MRLVERGVSVYQREGNTSQPPGSRMRRARLLALAVLLHLLPFVPARVAQAVEPLRLVLDSAYAPNHVPILLAVVRGNFARAGLDLVVEPGLGANMVTVLVGQRAFDLGHVTATAAAVAISRGTPIRMVALYQPRSAQALVGIKGKVRLEGPKSVEGLRLGITPGTIDSMLLSLFRRANNIGVSALTLIPTDRSAKLADLAAGRLDLVLGDGLVLRGALQEAGLDPEVLDLAEYGVPLQGFGFVASQGLLASNPDLLRNALAAIRAGFAETAADPLAACRAVRERFAVAESDAACAAVLRIFLARAMPAEAGWGKQSPEAWQRMIEAMRSVGEIQGTRPPSFYFTNAVVP